jgi:hypothetical protein
LIESLFELKIKKQRRAYGYLVSALNAHSAALDCLSNAGRFE